MNLKGLELFAIRITDHNSNPIGEVQEPMLVNTNLYTHHQVALIDAIAYADQLRADMVNEENVWWNVDGGPVREWTIEYNDDGAVLFCDGEIAWTVEAFIMTIKE
jgi:hypothetical protein